MSKHVQLKENLPKIVFSIAYVVNYAVTKKGKRPTQYDIVKSLFLADRRHMNRFGRPVTFDNYVAMKHGPVPSLAYDLLMDSAQARRALDGRRVPWEKTNLGKSNEYHSVNIDDFELYLSSSDLEVLKGAYETVLSLGFDQIRKLTHEDPSYIEAWKDDHPTRRQFKMRLDLLFDEPDLDEALRVKELSEFA